MTETLFVAPVAPTGRWEDMTENEKAWVEFIRVISNGTDPRITSGRVRAMRALLDDM